MSTTIRRMPDEVQAQVLGANLAERLLSSDNRHSRKTAGHLGEAVHNALREESHRRHSKAG